MSTFGERFRELREELGLSQEELIRQFNEKYSYNFSPAAVSQYENNKRTPEINALKCFADFFNVSVDYLLAIVSSRNEERSTKLRTFTEILRQFNISQIKEDDAEYLLNILSKISILTNKTFVISPNEPLKHFDSFAKPSEILESSALSQNIIDFITAENEDYIRLAWMIKEAYNLDKNKNSLDNEMVRRFYEWMKK